MSSRAKRILELCRAGKSEDENFEPEDRENIGSSPTPSLPLELLDLFNSDDSDRDRDYNPDESRIEDSSGDETESFCKRKKTMVSKTYPELLPAHVFNLEKDIPIEEKTLILEAEKASDIQSNQGEREDTFNIEINETPLTKSGKVRLRGLKSESRKVRNERKELRNQGFEYKTKKGILVKARKSEHLGLCRNKCAEKIPDNIREAVFEDYWKMNDYNKRCNYIAVLMDLVEPKRKRERKDCSDKTRLTTVKYHVEVEGSKVVVCKSCFLKVFGENRRMLETVIQKKRASSSGLIQPDARGNFQKTSLAQEDKEKVRDFLLKIPAYESHYSRRDCGKKFVAPYLTITALYTEYKTSLPEASSKPVSFTKFREEFHNLNLKIKKRKVDTCSKCDRLQMQIKFSSEEEKVDYLKQHHDHLDDAEFAYESKNLDKEKSKIDRSTKTVTFDMQQCLPTPLVHNSVAFYKRQLWTFNLTVYDCTEGSTYCYLWHEGIAGRGANEFGSCMYSFISEATKPEVTCLTMYSDTCGGQNKNTHVAAMCMVALQNSPELKEINHKFLVPGHTHMECDTSHALIEKRKKTFHGNIHHPHDWAQLVQSTGKKHPFVVKEMNGENFYNFAMLLKSDLQQRKQDVVGNSFSWRDVQWLKYLKSEPGIVFYKTSLDPYQPFQCISFKRRCNEPTFEMNPSLRYKGQNPIPDKKKKDLLDLLPFISPVFHPFYKDLMTSQEAKDTYPDDMPDEDNEEGVLVVEKRKRRNVQNPKKKKLCDQDKMGEKKKAEKGLMDISLGT